MIQHPLEIPRAIHEAFHIARTGRPGPRARRHPAGPLARRHRLRAGHRRAPARLPADGRGQREADPPGRQGAGRRAAPGALRRRRRRSTRTPRRSSSSSPTSDRFPVTCTLHGPRRASRRRTPQWLGMLGHARHARGQLRDGRGRPDLRDRRALRRPHHRQARRSSPRARSSSTSTSTRPRSPRTSRRTSRSSATPSSILAEARSPSTARSSADPSRLDDWWERIDGWREKYPLRYEDSTDARDQAAVRDPGALRGDRRRRDRHHRRRPAPDVDGAVLPLPRAAPLDQLRRPGHDGLRPAGGDGRRRSGCPDETVVCISGDGSIQMNAQELATCAQNGIPVKVVHHEQRLPRHGPPVAGAVLGRALLARRHGRSSPTSSSSPRPTAATGMRLTDKTTLVEDLQGGDRDRRARSSSTSASPARRTRTR